MIQIAKTMGVKTVNVVRDRQVMRNTIQDKTSLLLFPYMILLKSKKNLIAERT